MNHLDLFSGIGGFALAASWVWGEEHNIISFVEIDKYCQKVLKKHWPDVPIHDDIRTYRHDETKIDLLSGGPPCTATSVAAAIHGKRTGSTLWPEMGRVVEMVKPKWVIVEQPSGNKEWEDKVKKNLESYGYCVARFKRKASDCGLLHQRRRSIFVAHASCKRLLKISRVGKSCQAKEAAWITPPRGAWRSARTGNCRVDDGDTYWVDRLRALGNAIVPQCVMPIMQAIKTQK